jgi:hypothetical protein
MGATTSKVSTSIESPLTRIRKANQKVLPFSVNLSCSALESQIVLRERLLRDIEAVRLRLQHFGERNSRPVAEGRRRRPIGRVSERGIRQKETPQVAVRNQTAR